MFPLGPNLYGPCRAKPNEWMLVIRDGKTLKAGIGLHHWPRWEDTVVKFPSTIFKVSFSAEQVSSEMSGLRIEGFVMWTVNREDDGPFKAYRSLDALTQDGITSANTNLKNLSESIVRSQVANMKIRDVIANRDMLRDNTRLTMQKVLSGWGMWLETVEITDVKVLSKSLFDNMQAEFRETNRKAAELLQLTVNREITERRLQEDLEEAKKRVDAHNAQQMYEAEESQRVEQAKEKLMEETHRVRKALLEKQEDMRRAEEEMDRKAQLARIEKQKEIDSKALEVEFEIRRRREQLNHDIAAAALSAELQLATQRAENEAAVEKIRIMSEQLMNDTNMRALAIRNSKEIYQSIQDLKVVHVSGAGDKQGPEALIPGLAAIQAAGLLPRAAV